MNLASELLLTRKDWRCVKPGLILLGHPFLADKKLTDGELVKLVPKNLTARHEWSEFLGTLNGFYSLLLITEKNMLAAVDHVRGYPLFYAEVDGKTFVSDSAECLRIKLGIHNLDKAASEEFRILTYVTGSATLLPAVRQLQAGEFCQISSCGGRSATDSVRHYLYSFAEPKLDNREALRDVFYEAIEAAIDRLLCFADGSQIAIPLSGGFDSRLIASALARRGVSNILTYTYGDLDSHEAKTSRLVAEALGLPWHFVEYTSEKWRDPAVRHDQWQYQLYAGNYSSLPHLQDWLAVREMKERGVLQQGAVCVPGHSGDMLAGSLLPPETFLASSFNRSELARLLVLANYQSAPWRFGKFGDINSWKSRVLELLGDRETWSRQEFAEAFDFWNWAERVSKFLVNSARVYEYFACRWWMPLWDKQIVDCWQRAPLAMRKGTYCYSDLVQEYFKAAIGPDTRIDRQKAALLFPDNPGKSNSPSLGRTVFRAMPAKLRRLINGPRSYLSMVHDPLRPLDRIGRMKAMVLIMRGYSSNGISARDVLDRIGSHAAEN